MEKKTKAEIRHDKIRSMLIAKNFLTLSEFCEILNSSEATIRNDLRHLEEKGLIQRTYGGAIATGNTAFNSNMSMRSAAFKAEKESIANYVVNNILYSGQTIVLDAGTTNVEIAKKIVESSLKLTVLTNSFAAASILSESENIKLYVAGGYYDNLNSSFCDEQAQKFFSTMYADIFFLSVNGISTDVGFTISGNQNVSIKHAMLKSSKKCIVVADHSKLDKIGLKVVCGFNDVDTLLTDNKADREYINQLTNEGLDIILAT